MNLTKQTTTTSGPYRGRVTGGNKTQLMKTTKPRDGGKKRGALADARQFIEREFRVLREQQPRVFHLALNEAEAMAYQTGFPYLVFPELAMEKAQALADWQRRQESVRRSGEILAFPA
jgi:hypothetical protein